jgi:heme O synthase-like polyprenyltransferase
MFTELAGGSEIFLAFLITFFFAVVYSLFTKRGSGINARPYNKVYGGAPGASVPSGYSGHDDLVSVRDWGRGAR